MKKKRKGWEWKESKTGTGGYIVYADTELDNEDSDENVAELGQLKISHRIT